MFFLVLLSIIGAEPPKQPPPKNRQEARYMQILADKLLALQPDLILTGKAVGRHAQEHLRRHKVCRL